MLLRHSIQYLLIRGVPGFVNLAALALFTRLLTVDEFGQYAMVVAGVGLANVILFQWLLLVLVRFLPAHLDAPKTVKDPVLGIFLVLGVIVCLVGIPSALLLNDSSWTQLALIAVVLLVAQAWLQLNLWVASTQLEPAVYGRLLGAKSVLALLIGGSLAWLGAGVKAPLIGLVVGSVLASSIFGFGNWKGVRPKLPSQSVLSSYARYGVPLVITFALGWVISSSDRVIIAWLINESATGLYASGYDLSQFALGFVLAAVNTAAFPLVLRALEQKGVDAAGVQLKKNGDLIISLSLAGAAGLIALAPSMVKIFIGQEFRSGALDVMPLIAIAAAIAGIKAFHLDVAFHLARKSRWLVATGAIAAILNVGMNIILIPVFGIIGAAWATLVAFCVAALASFSFGRRVFGMPPIMPLLGRAFVVAGATYSGARLISEIGFQSWSTLISGLLLGVVFGAIAAFALDVAGIKTALIGRKIKWTELRS